MTISDTPVSTMPTTDVSGRSPVSSRVPTTTTYAASAKNVTATNRRARRSFDLVRLVAANLSQQAKQNHSCGGDFDPRINCRNPAGGDRAGRNPGCHRDHALDNVVDDREHGQSQCPSGASLTVAVVHRRPAHDTSREPRAQVDALDESTFRPYDRPDPIHLIADSVAQRPPQAKARASRCSRTC